MFENPLKQLKAENVQLADQLSNEDRLLIHNIICRMNVLKVNSLQAQIIQRDLIGMAFESQKRGTPFANELGDNLEVFADEVYESVGSYNWKELLLGLTIRVSGYFFLWFLMSSLMLFGGFTWRANWSIYVFYAAIATLSFIVERLMTPHFVMKQGIKHHLPHLIGLVLFISIAATLLTYSAALEAHLINVLPAIIVSGAVYIMAQLRQNQLFLRMVK